ncbi:hypothetical protein AB0L68_30210 [Streptomyces sp. NPDC052164]|uniref:hypothetical protein n=1 Tax=Streptomyces sp. NPDC052164 TaxID=3155529 RepID=UPI00343A1851
MLIEGYDGPPVVGISASGLTWHGPVRIDGTPAPGADGAEDSAARLPLGLPLLDDLDVPEGRSPGSARSRP